MKTNKVYESKTWGNNFFLVIGVFLIVFGFGLISSGMWLDMSYGQVILPIGIVITVLVVLGCIVVLIRRKK
ncbi:MAG: hypothetical protein ACW98X_21160 [Promethearchaeota archaeon]